MRIYKIVQNVILAAAILIITILAVLIYTLHIHPYIVMSGSMEPDIKTGSLCFISCDDKDVDVGDVIAYKSGDMIVTHRIIDVTNDGYITKGDNNDTADLAPVPQNAVMGKAVFSIPRLGYLIMAIKTPRGVIITAAVLIVFILIGILNNKARLQR